MPTIHLINTQKIPNIYPNQEDEVNMIIVVAHNKGGVGKTSISLNLAATLKPSLIIDQDLHQGLAIINQLRDKQLPVITCETKVELINALKQSDSSNDVLVDCGGFDSNLNRISIAAADLVIVPANGDITEKIGLRRFDEMLIQLSEDMEQHIRVHVLFNRVHHAKRNFGEIENFISSSKHMTRLNTVIPFRKVYPMAMEEGLSVVEYPPTKQSSAAQEVKALAKEVKILLRKQKTIDT